MARRSVLRHIGGRAPILAADRQTLRQSHEHQEHRSPDTNLRVGRKQPDDDRRETHHDHGNHEAALATDAVTESPEYYRAERPHRKTGAERRETREKRRGFIAGWEKQAAEKDGEAAVQKKVIPLEDRSE